MSIFGQIYIGKWKRHQLADLYKYTQWNSLAGKTRVSQHGIGLDVTGLGSWILTALRFSGQNADCMGRWFDSLKLCNLSENITKCATSSSFVMVCILFDLIHTSLVKLI